MKNFVKLAVIGDPIEHSKSPEIHGAALKAIGADYEYEKVRVKAGELETFIKRAVESGTDGFNLTMPHKVDIIPYLESIDEEALRYGAVNTVKIVDGKLHGYNTDAEGYSMALKMRGRSFKGASVVLLGAGGVVRTLALRAAAEGANCVTVLNRTQEKAAEVAKAVQCVSDIKTWCGSCCSAEIAEAAAECDILINATPLGMHGCGEDYNDLSFMPCVKRGALVSDLIYNPEKTRFLAEAESLGYEIMNGKAMLIFQAILSDKIYTESDFDVTEVYKCVNY